MMIVCSGCAQDLPAESFHRDPKTFRASGRKSLCRSCYNRSQKVRRDARAEMATSCDACGSTERLCVDHDHRTFEVRGTLCNRCNLALGLLADDAHRIRGLLRYLRNRV